MYYVSYFVFFTHEKYGCTTQKDETIYESPQKIDDIYIYVLIICVLMVYDEQSK